MKTGCHTSWHNIFKNTFPKTLFTFPNHGFSIFPELYLPSHYYSSYCVYSWIFSNFGNVFPFGILPESLVFFIYGILPKVISQKYWEKKFAKAWDVNETAKLAVLIHLRRTYINVAGSKEFWGTFNLLSKNTKKLSMARDFSLQININTNRRN